MLGGLNNFKGKEVIVTLAKGYGSNVEEVRGVVKSALAFGNADVALLLENGVFINMRFVIQIKVNNFE